jgi:nucleoside-diphosphate-sugar epimerase
MNKCLITGYKGYIGSHLYNNLAKLGYETVGIDLKDGDDILHCLPNENFDYVFHLAALPKVEYSIHHPSYTLKQNVLVTSTLLEWAKNHKTKRVIFSSSAAVMGDGNGIPKSPYGLHKLMSEMECRLFSKLYDLDTVCLRYSNVYSEDQPFGGAYATAVCAWMEMIKQDKVLRIDGDGEQTRDLVHVDDIVSANVFCMKFLEDFKGQFFNVGSGRSCSMNYVREIINKNHKVKWNWAPERPGDIRHAHADISGLKKLGWEPKISIQEGLERCFNKGENNEII